MLRRDERGAAGRERTVEIRVHEMRVDEVRTPEVPPQPGGKRRVEVPRRGDAHPVDAERVVKRGRIPAGVVQPDERDVQPESVERGQ